jgi:hypothetical protein
MIALLKGFKRSNEDEDYGRGGGGLPLFGNAVTLTRCRKTRQKIEVMKATRFPSPIKVQMKKYSRNKQRKRRISNNNCVPRFENISLLVLTPCSLNYQFEE